MSKRKQSKPPAEFTIDQCDDLEVEIEGEKFYPHAEESVTLKRAGSVDEILLGAKLGSMGEGADPQEIEETLVALVTYVASKIVAWDWTGDDGEPLGDPTDPVTIRGLGMSEQLWLYRRISGNRASKRDRGKDSSSSA